MKLSPVQNTIHNRAMYLAKRHTSLEAQLVETIRDVERLRIHEKFEMSLFKYVTHILKLSDSLSYALITVTRKAKEVPSLRAAIQDKSLTLSKASRIVSSLNVANANELIDFAKNHSRSEIDHELARRNPKSAKPDKAKPINDDQIELTITVKRSTYEKFKRAESLEAQRQKSLKAGDVFNAMTEAYLDKFDPIRKAERSVKRKLWQARVDYHPKSDSTHFSPGPQDDRFLAYDNDLRDQPQAIVKTAPATTPKRIPLTAEQKHAVFLRDKGRCTQKDINNHVCGSDKWTDIHHIIRIADGGTNDLDNLTTLCSFHHDLVHQLSLPVEGQVNWLRSPARRYG